MVYHFFLICLVTQLVYHTFLLPNIYKMYTKLNFSLNLILKNTYLNTKKSVFDLMLGLNYVRLKSLDLKGIVTAHPGQTRELLNNPWLLDLISFDLTSPNNERYYFFYYFFTGPVRSISFHPTLSLFLTGSDDCTVKVW